MTAIVAVNKIAWGFQRPKSFFTWESGESTLDYSAGSFFYEVAGRRVNAALVSFGLRIA